MLEDEAENKSKEKDEMAHFGDMQNAIYNAGLSGVLPDYPVDFASLQARAEKALSPMLLNYVQGGCGDEHTQYSNASAFHHWGMVPRMLVDCSERDLSIELFGTRYHSPIFMAPIGLNGEVTQDRKGDVAAARASAETGVPFCASTLSNTPIEEVATAAGNTPGFFQLYTPKHEGLAESLIQRAETAGYRALVITLDTWLTGWRPRDLNTANFPQLRGKVLENYFSDPVFRSLLDKPPEEDLAAAVGTWAATFGKVLTWDHIAWFREMTNLPIVLKGICHADDARRAADLGVDAIYCSNHGGRQANGGIAAIDMLPGVVKGAGGTPVLFDSGVRSGSDVIKAIALGATAVGIGRPYLYGLAIGGAGGAAHVLRSILAEADLLMAVNGYPTLEAVRSAGAEITRD
ncbi:lactate 2-monooxygenase [Altererythrobacter xiamenensis]|uniref:Lactate 2-monooxygenase n=1 Tax=Altererythrobacter xiamenensis TaxID=1316679 RepID=A0A1Y6F446_9SPHN|nr:alpha-hydroxy-acid oxidizing protein [Altererythrobacter xiamenensis]SMQ69645.1 lactate 2-monooxygenase [Altererythrobacter xiamenensis]